MKANKLLVALGLTCSLLTLGGWTSKDMYASPTCNNSDSWNSGFIIYGTPLKCYASSSSFCDSHCPINHDAAARQPSTLGRVEFDVNKDSSDTYTWSTAVVCARFYGSTAFSCTSSKYITTPGFQTVTFYTSDLAGIRAMPAYSAIYAYLSLGRYSEFIDYIAYWN